MLPVIKLVFVSIFPFPLLKVRHSQESEYLLRSTVFEEIISKDNCIIYVISIVSSIERE